MALSARLDATQVAQCAPEDRPKQGPRQMAIGELGEDAVPTMTRGYRSRWSRCVVTMCLGALPAEETSKLSDRTVASVRDSRAKRYRMYVGSSTVHGLRASVQQ